MLCGAVISHPELDVPELPMPPLEPLLMPDELLLSLLLLEW
jgi:hypothetical protein